MKLHSLSIGSKEFEEVAQYITKTWKNACIMDIQRVEDHCMFNKYNVLKQSMREPNERILFHGTNEAAVSSILEFGYDPVFAKTCAYGMGVYFAADAVYSYNYMPSRKDYSGFDLSFMLVNSVLVGRMIQGTSNSVCNLAQGDTQVDSSHTPKIFSVPRAEQAIPKYVIAFHKNAQL
jgi:hypothetical protein